VTGLFGVFVRFVHTSMAVLLISSFTTCSSICQNDHQLVIFKAFFFIIKGEIGIIYRFSGTDSVPTFEGL
jgi:hypothetical protein